MIGKYYFLLNLVRNILLNNTNNTNGSCLHKNGDCRLTRQLISLLTFYIYF